MPKPPKIDQEAWRAALTLILVESGIRNSRLEELHAGISPSSAVGDYSDVKVVTPYGEIPWSEVSRLCDAEMKALMIEVVNRVYTILTYPEAFTELTGAKRWNVPELDAGLMCYVARWQARQAGMPEQEIWAKWPSEASPRLPPIRVEQRVAAGLEEPEKPREDWSYEATPETLRTLADEPIADAAWIAKAREALKQAADGWDGVQLQVLDEIEATSFGQD